MVVNIRDGGPTVRGHVTFTESDDAGNVVRVVEADNAFTDTYASAIAQLIGAGGTPTMPATHISFGGGGFSIDRCDAIAGWASAPTLDTAIYREGIGCLSATQTASTSGTYMRYNAIGATDGSAANPEVWLRLNARATFDMANSQFRIYTGSSSSSYFSISLAGIEAALGSNFIDATWRQCLIPRAAFTGSGSPSWAAVTGSGVVVAANAGGSAVLRWDDVRGVASPLAVTRAATVVADERTKKALAALVYAAPLTLTASAYWTSGEVPGQYHVAGLWGGVAGATLMAIVAADFTKQPGFNLTVTWTLTFAGGA